MTKLGSFQFELFSPANGAVDLGIPVAAGASSTFYATSAAGSNLYSYYLVPALSAAKDVTFTMITPPGTHAPTTTHATKTTPLAHTAPAGTVRTVTLSGGCITYTVYTMADSITMPQVTVCSGLDRVQVGRVGVWPRRIDRCHRSAGC